MAFQSSGALTCIDLGYNLRQYFVTIGQKDRPLLLYTDLLWSRLLHAALIALLLQPAALIALQDSNCLSCERCRLLAGKKTPNVIVFLKQLV